MKIGAVTVYSPAASGDRDVVVHFTRREFWRPWRITATTRTAFGSGTVWRWTDSGHAIGGTHHAYGILDEIMAAVALYDRANIPRPTTPTRR